jgi:YVTN family beta-propeller protein
MQLPRRSCVILLFSLFLCNNTNARDLGYVIVTNEKTSNLAVIDPWRDYRVVKWIATSHRPSGIRLRDGGQQILVACADDNVIDVIDVATLTVIDHIPTGANPKTFELSQDGSELYVPNQQRSVVQEISIREKIITREFATGAVPEAVALSGDGKTLYVTSGIDDLVHVVDVAAGVVMENIKVGTRPSRFLLLPGAQELWVANELSGQISIIDRLTNTVKSQLDFEPPGPRQGRVTPLGMTVTADGKTAIIALGHVDQVAFVDTISRIVTHYVPVGRWARDIALSADETTLYVANGQSDDVSVVDVESRKVIAAIPVGGGPQSVLVDVADVAIRSAASAPAAHAPTLQGISDSLTIRP